MPCSDGRPSEPQVDAHMLCEAMAVVEIGGLLDRCGPTLRAWWETHKHSEEARVRREAAAKLTDRERLVLGIDEEGRPMYPGKRS